MYKILIADDEHLERRVIKFYLNKFYAEQIEISAEVSN
jgi:YesN/AraC family two-component response regulator